VRAFKLGLSVAVALLGLTGIASAAYTAPSLYDCRPLDPRGVVTPPPPELPPQVASRLPEAIASNHFERVCPPGEVPQPTGTRQFSKIPPRDPAKGGGIAQASRVWGAARQVRGGRRHARGRHGKRRHRGAHRGGKRGKAGAPAAASRESLNGYWYSWSIGEQSYKNSKGINGLWVLQTNEQPYIPTGESQLGSHSSGQLWAFERAGEGCFSTAETGWSESIGQFGDYSPHLFVYAIDCGVGIGYSSNEYGGLNWVQSSPYTFPNQALTHNDVFHVYGARMDGGNWWIYYDGQWVGFIPKSSWHYRFPYVINEAQAGGEVMTVNHSTCADMGYAGLYGGNPGAAMFGQVWYEYNYNTQSALTNLYSWSSDPSYYATGNWAFPPNHGYAFRYGGPGWC
jgi:Neprosin